MNRRLFKIILQRDKFDETYIQSERDRVIQEYNLKKDEIDYFVLNGTLVNNAYDTRNDKINILLKNGKVLDIADAADTLNIKSISGPIEILLVFPKESQRIMDKPLVLILHGALAALSQMKTLLGPHLIFYSIVF